MTETTRNSDSSLDDIAALLAEQVIACHAAAERCFDMARNFDSLDSLKVATRLIQASAAAASAIKRIKGSEFRQHVIVSHTGESNAA